MIIDKFTYRGANILIGMIEDDVEQLILQLSNFDAYTIEFQSIHLTKRKKEFLFSRILLNQLLGKDVQIIYNEENKPYLKDKSAYISITHSKNYVAVITHDSHPVGIDLELRTQKIINIASRFLSDTEQRYFKKNTDKIEIAWSAKEALFKIIGKKAVNFAESFEIFPFHLNDLGDLFVLFNHRSRIYKLRYHQNEIYTLVYVVDKKLKL